MNHLLAADVRARARANALAAMAPLTPETMAQRLIALYESLLSGPR